MRVFIAPLFMLLLMGPVHDMVAQDFDVAIPDTIFVSTVRFGKCDSLDIPIFNAGPGAVAIDTIRPGSVQSTFGLSPAFSPKLAQLDPETSHTVRLRFCPDSIGCFADSLFVKVRSLEDQQSRTYRIGVGGCSGVSQIEVDRQEVDLGKVLVEECGGASLRLFNRGTFPLNIDDLVFGADVFRIENGQVLTPLTIPSGEDRTIRLEFCPKTAGESANTLTIISDSYSPIEPIQLRGRGLLPRFGLDEVIDFGEVPVGAERDTIVVVANLDLIAPLTIIQAGPDDAATAGGFDTETIAPPTTRVVPPGDTIHLHVRFRPTAPGDTDGGFLLEDDQGLTDEILLKGEGVAPGIRLDTAYAEAGDTLTLIARVDAAGEIKPRIEAYRITLRLPPLALFPKEVMPSQGASATMNYKTDGTLTIEGDNEGKKLIGGKLLSIRFRGLSTGDSVNPVTIEDAEMTGLAPFAVAGHGLVALSGCDIGRSAPVMRKPLIRSVTPNPIAGEAAIAHRVPSGSIPLLRVYSIGGTKEYTIPLPKGSGEDQAIPARFNELLPGLYLLELRVGEARDVTTILIEPNGD